MFSVVSNSEETIAYIGINYEDDPSLAWKKRAMK